MALNKTNSIYNMCVLYFNNISCSLRSRERIHLASIERVLFREVAAYDEPVLQLPNQHQNWVFSICQEIDTQHRKYLYHLYIMLLQFKCPLNENRIHWKHQPSFIGSIQDLKVTQGTFLYGKAILPYVQLSTNCGLDNFITVKKFSLYQKPFLK